MESFKLAQSRNNLPIIAHEFGTAGPRVLILGGVHGDEIEGVIAAKALWASFANSFNYKLRLTLVCEFNVDGVLAQQRTNASGVDLNRNLPSQDWTSHVAKKKYHPGESPCSEPENQGLVEWLEKNKPQLIISLHSWKPMLNINGDCRKEAQIISKLTGYSIEESVGYPTPGSLGTFCGLEKNMPTLTYEIERNLAAKEIVKTHVPAILEALKLKGNSP